MTTDPTRAPIEPGAADCVQQLRTAWVQIQRAVQIINDHQLLVVPSERREAIEQLKAAQSLIHGVGESIGREIARAALTPAAEPVPANVQTALDEINNALEGAS
jgi:hypothetical protein